MAQLDVRPAESRLAVAPYEAALSCLDSRALPANGELEKKLKLDEDMPADGRRYVDNEMHKLPLGLIRDSIPHSFTHYIYELY